MIESFASNPIALLGVVFAVVSLLLGLSVAYLALRGYLANNQRPMLFIAIGFTLVILVPVIGVVGWAVQGIDDIVIVAIGGLVQTLGLLSILYGLWTPESFRPSGAS